MCWDGYLLTECTLPQAQAVITDYFNKIARDVGDVFGPWVAAENEFGKTQKDIGADFKGVENTFQQFGIEYPELHLAY